MIGAQRSGTTLMAHLLNQHSAITLATPKEPAFFTIHQSRGIAWYRECFGECRSVLLDATTWYSVGPTDLFPLSPVEAEQELPYDGVPRRIHDASPNARFIYMLRDPTARLYSAYCFYSLAEGKGDSFQQATVQNPFLMRGSDYIGQLRNFLEYFPLDRFHFVLFENFIRDPLVELARLLTFLDLPQQPITLQGKAANKNDAFLYNRMGNSLASLLGSRNRVDRLRRGLKKLGPIDWANTIDNCLRSRPKPLSLYDQDYIKAIFVPRNQSLAKQTGLDISQWRS